ncbi:S-layer homology domain-containing protein [Paenibacillus sp. MBLB4367]|uniref:S-layer homology domain-containing protein n=1 Tax=Paenibacillus sp. MBLB4367 TaxID=3384767 RepID=UPI0039080ACE
MYRKAKRFTIALLILCMMTIGLSPAYAAETSASSDSKGHWAETQLQAWLQKGYIQGYEDGSLRPDDSIRRGELMALINRVFQLKESAAIDFTDLPSSHWAHAEAVKAVKAGYIDGYDDRTIRVEAKVSRQELAVMVAKLLKLESTSDHLSATFTDGASIPTWSRAAISALASLKVIDGYADRTFKAEGAVTRAEAVVLLDRAQSLDGTGSVTGNVYGKAGVYGPKEGVAAISGNVSVTVPGVTLQNMKIDGDLTLGEGIGEGEVFLKNVTVTGKTFVNGGGENSVHFENSVLVKIIVNKKTGVVRIVASGLSAIQDIEIESPAKIEADGLTGKGIGSVVLSDKLPKGSQVTLAGTFESVTVMTQSLVVNIPKGFVAGLTIGSQATGGKFTVGKDASVVSLVLHAAASVFGQGEIKSAVVNSAGVEFDRKPNTITIGGGIDGNVKVKIGGVESALASVATPVPPVSGGGSGDGGSTTPPVTPPTGAIPQVYLTAEGSVTQSVYTYHQRLATVGDSVYAVSNMDATLYLVPSGTNKSKAVLELAVSQNKGLALAAKANTKVQFNTANLAVGDYQLFGVSSGAMISDYAPEQELRLSATAETPLKQNSISVYSNTHVVDIGFNKAIFNGLGSLEKLKQSVTEASYAPSVTQATYWLTAGDSIEIRDNVLRITFAQPVTGPMNIKIPAGALKDASHAPLLNDTFVGVDFGAVLTVLSQSPLKAGSNLTVQSDKEALVFLLPGGTSGTMADFNKLVAEGKGKSVTISANQQASISTAGLAAGRYTLVAWGGSSHSIVLE